MTDNKPSSSSAKLFRKGTNVIRAATHKSQHNLRILAGNFNDCPPINTKIIRIFISSTFSDMSAERNVIMKYLYPKLKSYCKETYGIEIQFLDMRWGVPSDSELDHKGPELCYQEILNCQQSSCGLNFIAIIGQRYGTINPPYSIPNDEFNEMIDYLKSQNESVELLKQWYVPDANNVPPLYMLQPIPVKSDKPTLLEIKEARASWNHIEETLYRQLSEAATILTKRGIFSVKQSKKYLSSVTEQEIELGICDVDTNKLSHTAAFIRNITDVENYINDTKVKKFIQKFIDLKSNESADNNDEINKFIIDDNLNQIMQNLINNSIKNKVKEENYCEINVKWNDYLKVINNPYLKKFQDKFYKYVKTIIDDSMKEKMNYIDEELYNEVIQHSISCINYVKHFQGRSELLNKVEEYLMNNSTKPLVIYGESGSGKTSIIAKCAYMCRDIMKRSSLNDSESSVIILRFLGTTPGTSNIRNTFWYIRKQLLILLNIDEDIEENVVDDYNKIINSTYELLKQLGNLRRVFLFIDSIDQLDRSNGAYTLSWLKFPLPEGVKMILSTLPNHEEILDNLQTTLEDDNCFVKVSPLTTELCMGILTSLLKEQHRTLTIDQMDILKSAFNQCSLPIYLQLIYRSVVVWRSYYDVDSDYKNELQLKFTVREAIFKFFRDLERKHNPIFVRHALGFITASRNGLSESELEDIMSLDDELLQSIFVYHLSPQIRVPPFLWSRLRRDVGSYLVEREADNTLILYWYHRQFIEVAREYFLADEQFCLYCHDIMSDYFLGTYANGRTKRFYYPEYIRQKLKLAIYSDEDRRVLAQPLTFSFKSEDNDNQIRYNLRKISELPWHLAKSGRHAEFADNIAFNYDFLLTKLKTSSRSDLLEDLQLLKSSVSYKNSLEELYNAIRLSAVSLSANPSNLGFDLCGRLGKFNTISHPRIKDLLNKTRTKSIQDIGYLPIGQCLESGSDDLYLCFDCGVGMGLILPNNTLVIFSMIDRTIKFYDSEGNFIKSADTLVNAFMCMKYMISRRPTKYQTCINVVLNVAKGDENQGVNIESLNNLDLEQRENDNDKPDEFVKIIYRYNFYTGKIIKIGNVCENFSKYNDGDFFDMGEKYIQIDTRLGAAALLKIEDQKDYYHYTIGVIHTHLSKYENYGVVLYKDSNLHILDIVDLKIEKCFQIYFRNSCVPCSCSIVDPNILILCYMENKILYINKYEIIDDIIIKINEFNEELNYNPKRTREVYFEQYDIFVLTIQHTGIYTDETIVGFVYNIKTNKLIFLKVDKKNSPKTKIFGESVMVEIDENEKYLFTTGVKCLFMVWDLKCGSLLKAYEMGSAEGLFCGIISGENRLAICHFGDESNSDEDKMYILCKYYNIDKLITNEDYNGDMNDNDDDVCFINDVIFNQNKYKYNAIYNKNELDGLIICNSKNSNDNYLFDAFENLTINLKSNRYYFNIDIIKESNDNEVTIIKYNDYFKGIDKIICLNDTLDSDNKLIDDYWNTSITNNCNDNIFYKKTDICYFDDIFSNWIIFINFSKQIIGFNINNQQEITTTLDVDDYKIPKSKSFVIKRPNYENQFIMINNNQKKNLLERLKGPKNNVKWIGKIIIFKLELVKKDDYMIDAVVLSEIDVDMGSILTLLNGDTLLNYKLERINIETRDKIDNAIDLPDNRYLIHPLLIGSNKRYVLGLKANTPYEIKFDLNFDDGDNNDDMFMLEPLRTLELYDLGTKTLIGDYFFENEIEYLLTFRNRNYFCQATNNNVINFMKINIDEDIEYSITKNVKENKVKQFEYLRKVLSKSLLDVNDKRPLDPISYIAFCLMNFNSNSLDF